MSTSTAHIGHLITERGILTSLKQNGNAKTAMPMILLLRLIINGQSEYRGDISFSASLDDDIYSSELVDVASIRVNVTAT